LKNLLTEANSELDMTAALINMLVPATDKPIDELVAAAYAHSEMAIAMISCLRDPDCRQWLKPLQCEL
jgi:hypothetical protein